MNYNLSDNGYIVLPEFITKKRSTSLSYEFLKHCKENQLAGDSQAPNSHSDYNYIPFLELLCEKTPEVSSIVGETVLPTYTYSRIYKNGSELTKHTDRDACEISLTVHLDGDSKWPIWIETPSGEHRCVELNPGDAMLYLGRTAPHWRDVYGGEHYTQAFLHYVRSRGDCAYTYFDKTQQKPEVSEVVEPPILEQITNNIETKIEVSVTKSRIPLEDYIITLDSIVPDELCDRILEEYRNCSFWTPSRTGDGNVSDQIRNCDVINISEDIVIQKNFDIRKKIDEDMFQSASKVLSEYRDRFPTIGADIDTGYGLLRYNKGQFYVQHTDSFKTQQRALSCSFLLNDEYEGGEFAFFDREIMIRGSKGSVIVFPSNFMYPHEILPVTSGTRYSIITWYV
jgi:Rps23 Pro-64 3,4-dihydroxylase Tpa1-like proline 4-hydroxylase